MAAKFTFLQNMRKRRREAEVEEEEAIFKRGLVSFDELEESTIFANILIAGAVSANIKSRKPRFKDKNRETSKLWWNDVYTNWTEEDFKGKMPLERQIFDHILNDTRDNLQLTPTKLKPNPTTPDRPLALTIYRLGTGCTYSTISDVFGVSVPSTGNFF